MEKYGRQYMPSRDRVSTYDIIEEGVTKVVLTDGRNRGKKGVITSKSDLKNHSYGRSYGYYGSASKTYNNYFSVRVDIGDRVVGTSCNYIEIIN